MRLRHAHRTWGIASGVAALIAAFATHACVGTESDSPPLLLQGIGTIVDASADADAGPLDAGEIVVLAAGIASASSIALDSSNVYWTDDVGAVWSVPRYGGTATLLTTGQSAALGLVVNGNGYWVGGNGSTAGSVEMYDFEAGTLAPLVTGLVNPFGLAVSPIHVYWTAQNKAQTAVELDEVQDDGGAPLQLASIAGALSPGSLAIDADDAYFALAQPGGGGAILSVPLAGGPPVTVWTTTGGVPTDVTLGAGGVYWLVASPAAVWSVSPGGTAATLAVGVDTPGHLCIDDENAYWTSPGDGQVFAVPLAGGTAGTMVENLITPMAIAVDADALYVSTVDSILKIAK